MREECQAEVDELHRFFVDWMTGTLPRTQEAYARFTGVMADHMVIISPRGVLTEREPLIEELEAAHGAHAGPTNDFGIRIENYRCHRTEGDLCLVTYEEWQQRSGATTGRLGTALFRRRAGTPNGVEWLHVHETWISGHGPAG